MIHKARRGQASYGEAIGILLLDTSLTPYIPGDVANATTYSFPVRFKKVKDLSVEMMMNKDTSLLNRLIESGRELTEEGVKAITGDSGYMAMFQREVAKKLKIPVFLSSLLQLPFLTRIIGKGQKVGIIAANSKILDNALLKEVGITDMGFLYIKGMEDKEYFRKTFIEEVGWLDSDNVEKEVVSVAKNMIEEEPKVKVILLECSCITPYRGAVQEAVNLPVFDYITMINYVYSAVTMKKYEGFM